MGSSIFVVDDDPSIRLLVTTLLSRLGYSVESAGDGAEALERLSDGAFDLLVIDLMMPRLDGFGILDHLDGMTNPPKVIVMTAAAPAIVSRLPRGRIWKVITKPFDLSLLVSEARSALGAAAP